MDSTKKHPLRIALIAPLVSPIAPPFLGGAQVLVYDLALGLAERGHRVTLFARAGSAVPGVEVVPYEALGAERVRADFAAGAKVQPTLPDFLAQGQVFLDIFYRLQHQQGFDIVHAHAFDWPAYAFGALLTMPMVHTIHLPASDAAITQLLAWHYRTTGTSNAVAVSQAGAASYAPNFPVDGVIYNGIDVENIPFGPGQGGYLLYAGRMAPEKGPDRAIAIAERAGLPLILAGNIYDQGYFDQTIAPRLAARPDLLTYRGALAHADVFTLMGNALGLLFPSLWDEPFGLTLAEAHATGCPVIAFDTGAVREIVADGETGFVVPKDAIDAAVIHTSQLSTIDRAACRQRMARYFSRDAMLTAYEVYYHSKL